MLGLGNSIISSPKLGSAFSLDQVSNLATWFQFNTNISVADSDSDGDADISWTSSHTDGIVASQTTDNQEPTTTGGYIHFDGSNDNLDMDSTLTLNEFTMFIAMDLDATTNETILGEQTNTQHFLRFGFGNAANNFRFRRGNSATNNEEGPMSESITTGEVNLMTIRCFNTPSTANTTLEIRRSTKSGSTITTNQVFNDTGSTFLFADNLLINTIGVQGGSGGPMDGKLYELAIYTGKVSDSDVALIEENILNRVV
tara:strand:- start:1007 stop:1774 length:768 start_codon:yes stop_codon:yes gene_type:complete